MSTHLALLVGTVVRVHRRLHSRTRYWVVYPLLSVYGVRFATAHKKS